MRFAYLIAFFLIFSSPVLSQRSDDLGFFLGGSSYMGDINPNRLIYKPLLAYGLDYRYNYNPVFSMKYTAKRGKLQADDLDFASSLYQKYRGANFKDNTIFEGAALVEYNFFPITMEKSGKDKFSPYVNFGLAVVYMDKSSPKIQVVIPFGVGLKYRMSRRIELAAEWMFRRTFTDKIDNMTTYYTDIQFTDRQRSFSNNRDWYSFFGINLHYCLRNMGFRCPAYNEKK